MVANVYKEFPLPPFSFEGLEFPWESYEIVGGIRDHIHEYPHTHGGDPEKLGRKLYEIKVTPIIQAGLLPERYAQLFPDRLKLFRDFFEEELTGKLVIPHIGAIQAYARSWTEKASSQHLSGLDVEWLFIEDQSGLFGESFLMLASSLESRLSEWTIEASTLPSIPGIFDQIHDAALQILAIKDQQDMYGALFLSKLEGLISLIQEADTQVSALNDPDSWFVLEAMHRVLAAAVDLGKDIAGSGKGLQLYTVPMTMSVSQIAISRYGSPARAVEIMQLNAFENPLAVPAGTQVVYAAA